MRILAPVAVTSNPSCRRIFNFYNRITSPLCRTINTFYEQVLRIGNCRVDDAAVLGCVIGVLFGCTHQAEAVFGVKWRYLGSQFPTKRRVENMPPSIDAKQSCRTVSKRRRLGFSVEVTPARKRRRRRTTTTRWVTIGDHFLILTQKFSSVWILTTADVRLD